MITQVTFTGIDAQTDIGRLADIQKRYPFVEFGVLVSRSRQGKENRYPQLSLLERFEGLGLNLSCHVCGSLAHEIILENQTRRFARYSDASLRDYLGRFMSLFKRIQLNVAEAKDLPEETLIWIPTGIEELIIQHNPTELQFRNINYIGNFELAHLMDASGGRGKETNFIPHLWDARTGYAGGLNPENIIKQIQPLLKVKPSVEYRNDFWIDMESGVRTNDWFDLNKVESVLKKLMEDKTFKEQLNAQEKARIKEQQEQEKQRFIYAMGNSLLNDPDFSFIPTEEYEQYILDAIWYWKHKIGCKRALHVGDEKAWTWIRKKILQIAKNEAYE